MKPPLTDPLRRRIRYLRVSVTDRCNYRCQYCMPVEGYPHVDRRALLTLEELLGFVSLMVELGVERVRITGGEPLARRGVLGLVRDVAALPGVREVAMTTNGHLLERFADDLWEAGLRSLCVSIDTFRADRFAEITRGGELGRVLDGLHAAGEAGFTGIKINAVAIRGLNDDELPDFAARCWENGWVPRFIELMPVGHLDFQTAGREISTAELVERVGAVHPLRPVGRPVDVLPRGPAGYWQVTSGPFAGHRLGIISPMSDDGFCDACNRARLTARGGLRACLANDDEVSILQAVRRGASRDELVTLVRAAVEGKLPAHRMRGDFVPLSVMTGIGG